MGARSTDEASVAHAALAYADRGWPAFPCQGKRPLVAHGLMDATTDRAVIERWWTRIWPGANIAVRTGSVSRLLVLDVDGEAGADALHELEHEHGKLPRTVESQTGGGGTHVFFEHPGQMVRNSAGRLGHGLDVRGDQGYVVVPPSTHASGRAYFWVADAGPDDLPLAAVPGWLLALLATAPSRNGSTPDEPIPEGQRNAHLASLAGSMRKRGMSREAIDAALEAENGKRCRPPLQEREVHRIAASVGAYKPDAKSAFALEVLTAKALCSLPDPPLSDELLGPLVVRGGRVVLGGHTGEGKTTMTLALVRAIVLRERFLDWRGAGGRALVIDAEQGLKTIKRRLRESALDRCEDVDYVRVPDGLSLDSDEQHVAAVEELLAAGDYAVVAADPLYKLHAGDSNAEREAVDLMRRFDAWRERYRFALLLPVHCRKPPIGAKFTMHEFFGSSAYLRGAEVVLGLQRVRDGYARLHYFKDRDGDLPIGTAWGLLFDRESGYRRDPDDEKPKQNAAGRIRELVEAQPGIRTSQLVEASGYAERTVTKALKDIGADGERPGRNVETLWSLGQDGDE